MTEQNPRLPSRTFLYTLLTFVVVGIVIYALRGVLAPVMTAFLLAYIFEPLVEFLSRHKVPRSVAGILCLVLLVLILSGLFALIVPTIHQELAGLAERFPAYLERIHQSFFPWLERTFGLQLPDTLGEMLDAAANKLNASAGELAAPVANLLQNVLSGAVSLIVSLVYVIIIPLFTFYFLADYHKITGWFANLVPVPQRPRVLEIAGEIDTVLSGFLRGQGTVCSILAVIYAIALSLAGVPAGVTIGVLAGLFNFVPYLGTATGLLLSFLFLLLEGSGWGAFLSVAAIFVGVNIIDGLFLTPRILGRKLGLAPVAVILAIMAFGEVFGFVGVLMAVPLTAIGKVLGTRALKTYHRSRAYRGQERNGETEETEAKRDEEDQVCH
jgi:predicted PurR-regulated permease PerM